MSQFSSSFPNSTKVHVEGPRGVRVPMREIALERGAASIRVYDTSGPQNHDVAGGLPKLREPWVAARLERSPSTDAAGIGSRCVTQLHYARKGEITPEMEFIALREGPPAEFVRDEVARGRAIIPANVNHLELEPMVIGRNFLVKINANIGNSAVTSSIAEEVEKMVWAIRWGADTVMDLSTGGNLDECREAIIRNSRVPIGTVPIYSMIIGRKLYDLDHDSILKTLEHQAQQGVDYFTIHAGVLREHLPYVKDRLIGIVSRGGSLLAKWMIDHHLGPVKGSAMLGVVIAKRAGRGEIAPAHLVFVIVPKDDQAGRCTYQFARVVSAGDELAFREDLKMGL